MKKVIISATLLAIGGILACNEPSKNTTQSKTNSNLLSDTANPKQLLRDAYQLFKEGNDSASIRLANEVLAMGKQVKNDTLVGRALTSLCRNAQRSQDTTTLAELSKQLEELSQKSGDQHWMMYRAHMNAEMWRLLGNMDRAEMYYNESLAIAEAIGANGMFTIDHFNKSFVSTAKGDFAEAKRLITSYYDLRLAADSTSEDAYGLIAMAYWLEQQHHYEAAHEVAVVTRNLFKEQNLFPEPPDEKPLIMVEEKVANELDAISFDKIKTQAKSQSVNSLLAKYLN